VQGLLAASGGDRTEEREGERRRENMVEKRVLLPCGVHISETCHQNHLMVKNERF
jgi:hypothetical protein